MKNTIFILPLVRERYAFDRWVSFGVHSFGVRQIKAFQEASIRKPQQLHTTVPLTCNCLGHKMRLLAWRTYMPLVSYFE